MFGIGQFFKKIQNSYTKEVFLRTVIRDAIKKNTGVELPITAISIKGSTVNLGGANQSLKSAIYIRKQAILKEIAAAQTIREITDLR